MENAKAGSADENKRIVECLHRLELIRRMRIQCMLKGTDAHRGQGPILDYIEQHPGCTQADAAEGIGISAPSIACSVRRMEKAGLIKRTADECDLRRNRLELTEKGRKNHIRIKELFRELDEAMLYGLDGAEKQLLISFLDRMTANLGKDKAQSSVSELIKELHRMEDENRE